MTLPMPSDHAAPALAASILIVDDDVELCDLVSEYLISQGLRAEAVHDGSVGLDRALSGTYSLVVLDVMLPGVRGFEVLRKIRTVSTIPVVMLTAHGDDVEGIVGLEIGADHYLSKPFNARELAARIHAVLRRASATSANPAAAPSPDLTILGDLEADSRARLVRCNGRSVPLTSVEFELMAAFSKLPGQIIPRDELANASSATAASSCSSIASAIHATVPPAVPASGFPSLIALSASTAAPSLPKIVRTADWLSNSNCHWTAASPIARIATWPASAASRARTIHMAVSSHHSIGYGRLLFH